MATTIQSLTAAYTAASLGLAPSQAITAALDAKVTQVTSGHMTDDQALAETLALVDTTTRVAAEAYQFFTGHAPSAAGLAYLVNSTANTTDLNDAAFANFGIENRFINFAFNLAIAGEGKAAFTAAYSGLDFATVVATAYDKIIGNSVALAKGVVLKDAYANFTSATNIAYLTAFAKSALGLTVQADIDMAVKAGLIAEILSAGVTYKIGAFYEVTSAMIVDLSDGTLSTDNAAGVNLFNAYPAAGGVGATYTLTAGIDTFPGTSANDTFVASSVTANLVTALDSLDGGAGNDTLTITDGFTASNAAPALAATATIKNIETINLTTTGRGTLNTSTWAGVTNVNVTSADTAAAANLLTVSDTTTATLTVTAGTAAIVGGVVDTLVNAGPGTNDVNGVALTSVSVTGGGVTNIGNDTSSITGTKSTLTSVTLKSVDATANLFGKGIATVTVGGVTTGAQTVNVTNATASHALTLIAQGTNTSAGVANVTTLTDAGATSLAINATAKASVALTGSTLLTAVTSTGVGALTLNLASIGAITSFDASTATGAQTLTNLAAATTSIKTGSGADVFTVTATAKATVASGAGNDVVTLGSALAAGSTISLGDGNDKLSGLLANAPIVSGGTAATTTVIDGGAGTDTVSSALINAGNGTEFVSFEVLGLENLAGATLDTTLLAGLASLELASTTESGVYTGLTTSQTLAVTADSTGAATTLTFASVAGAADAYTIGFNAVGSTTTTPLAIGGGTVTTTGIEALTINSGAASGLVANSITLADANARTVALTGSQALTVTFGAGFGNTATKGVTTIDGSAATGAITISTNNVTADAAGLSLSTGAGKDVITLTQATTVNSGAADDSITVQVGGVGSTITTGAGKDTVNVSAAVGANFVTITDAATADKIVFAGAGDTFTATKLALGAGVTTFALALDAASTSVTGAAAGVVSWFQYGGNTYIVEDNNNAATFTAGTDIVVKLAGLVDLSTASYAAGTHTLTLG